MEVDIEVGIGVSYFELDVGVKVVVHMVVCIGV